MMTNAELKSRARESLKYYYWWAVLACFLGGLLGGGSGSSIPVGNSLGTQGFTLNQLANISDGGLRGLVLLMIVIVIIMVIFLITFVIGLLWGTFVGNPVRVGCCTFFMESKRQQKNAGVGKLFWGFEGGRYKNIVAVMFMRWLYITLWSFLLLIPGIIKEYQYYLVPYILNDSPEIHYKDALQLSKDMMNGNKWRLFVLDLSFIGWIILATLCCGIGSVFLTPYIEATHLEFYEDVREQYLKNSYNQYE